MRKTNKPKGNPQLLQHLLDVNGYDTVYTPPVKSRLRKPLTLWGRIKRFFSA